MGCEQAGGKCGPAAKVMRGTGDGRQIFTRRPAPRPQLLPHLEPHNLLLQLTGDGRRRVRSQSHWLLQTQRRKLPHLLRNSCNNSKSRQPSQSAQHSKESPRGTIQLQKYAGLRRGCFRIICCRTCSLNVALNSMVCRFLGAMRTISLISSWKPISSSLQQQQGGAGDSCTATDGTCLAGSKHTSHGQGWF